MTTSDSDYSTIPDSAWTLFDMDESHRYYVCHLDDERSVIKTEFIANEALIRSNQDELFDSNTRRFADTQKVASIPLNVFYDPRTQIIEKLQQGDKDHMKWWLNHGDNRMWRNFRGRI